LIDLALVPFVDSAAELSDIAAPLAFTRPLLGKRLIVLRNLAFRPKLVGEARRAEGAKHQCGDAKESQERNDRIALAPEAKALGPADMTSQDRLTLEKPSQVIAELAGTRVTLGRLLPQAFQADGFEVARCLGLQPARRNRV